MSTTDLLQEIRDRLGDLPSRLAGVVGTSGGGRCRNAQGQFTSESGQIRPAGFDSSAQRLGYAIGQFVPGVNHIMNFIGAMNELEEAGNQFVASLIPGRSQARLPSTTASFPSPVQAQSLPASQPSTAPKLPSGTPLGFSLAGVAANGPGGTNNDLTAVQRQLIEEVRRLREVMRQQEPDQGEDTERLPSKEIQEGPTEETNDYRPPPRQMRQTSPPRIPLRPKTDVPSGVEDLHKKSDAGAAIAKLIF